MEEELMTRQMPPMDSGRDNGIDDQGRSMTRRSLLRVAGAGAGLALAGGLLPAHRFAAAQSTPAASQVDVEKAKSEGKVSLYTSLDTKILDSIIAGFKDKYGIDVEYFRAGSADVSGRVLAEADAGGVRADMVDASDVGAFLAMKKKGILKPYRSPEAESVPAEIRDPDDMWVADRLTQAVLQYNTDKLGDIAPPTSWNDLKGDEWKGKLTYFSSSSGDGAPRLYTMAKAFGWELLEAYAANNPLRVETPQLITQTLENGERVAGFAQNDNIAWRSKGSGKPTDYVYPKEGVATEPGAVGLIDGADHPNAAMLFFDYWMSAAGMKLLIDGGKYSSRTDLDPPKGSPPLSEIKLLVLDYDEYQTNRADILERMTKTFGGEWGV
jgi:iron(III) transport system substrate-binding protein